MAGKNPNPTAKGAYPIATLTWILAYKTGNGRNTKAIQDTFYKLLSDEYQDKAPPLGFVPLKGDILEKSRAAVKKIGRYILHYMSNYHDFHIPLISLKVFYSI